MNKPHVTVRVRELFYCSKPEFVDSDYSIWGNYELAGKWYWIRLAIVRVHN